MSNSANSLSGKKLKKHLELLKKYLEKLLKREGVFIFRLHVFPWKKFSGFIVILKTVESFHSIFSRLKNSCHSLHSTYNQLIINKSPCNDKQKSHVTDVTFFFVE